jgi:hypothetical protein
MTEDSPLHLGLTTKKTSLGGEYFTPSSGKSKGLSIGSTAGAATPKSFNKDLTLKPEAAEAVSPRKNSIISAAINMKRRPSLAQQIFKERTSVTAGKDKRIKSMDSVKSLVIVVDKENSAVVPEIKERVISEISSGMLI